MSLQGGNDRRLGILSIPVPPPYPEHTFLLDLAIWTYLEAVEWANTAEDIADVAILGQYLAIPFQAVSVLLTKLSNFFAIGDDWLVDVYLDLRGLIDGWKLIEILDSISDAYTRIREDPVNFIIDSFTAFRTELADFIHNPILWFINLGTTLVSWFPQFLYDPYNWIVNQVETLAWWVRVFWEDPGLFIDSWIAFLWPDYYAFKANPLGFILERLQSIAGWFGWFINWPDSWIVETLRSLRQQIGLFLDDPIGYVRRRIAEELGIPEGMLFTLDLWMFERFLDSLETWIWQRLDFIRDLVCTIIVNHFL